MRESDNDDEPRVPWGINFCVTIRADSEEEANALHDKLARSARRLGFEPFTDHSGPLDANGDL